MKWFISRLLICVIFKVHFENNQWETRRLDGWIKLKPNAVPTIFDVPNPPKRFTIERKSLYKVCWISWLLSIR